MKNSFFITEERAYGVYLRFIVKDNHFRPYQYSYTNSEWYMNDPINLRVTAYIRREPKRYMLLQFEDDKP
jgi:hypothetical protein